MLAALLIALIGWRAPVSTTQPAASTGEHPLAKGLREWLDGLGIVFRERTLALIFAVIAITSIGEGVMGVLFVVFIVTSLRGGAQELGGMMSAQAVGGLIGGALCGLLGNKLLSRWSLGLSSIIFGAIDLAIFNAPRYFTDLGTLPRLSWLSPLSLLAWELGLFVIVGIPGVMMFTGLQSLLQLRAPERFWAGSSARSAPVWRCSASRARASRAGWGDALAPLHCSTSRARAISSSACS